MAFTYAKITHFFGGLKWGWTESWYWAGDGLFLADALSDAKKLAINRRLVLGTVYTLEAFRVEEVTFQGNSKLTGNSIIAYDRGGCGPGQMTGTCQNPWQALYARFYGEGGADYARNYYMRGIPDQHLCINSTYTVPFNFPLVLTNALRPYFGLITSGTAVGQALAADTIRFRVVSEPLGKDISQLITDVQVVEENRWQITVADPIQIQTAGAILRDAIAGDVIHVSGPRKPWARGLSGDHIVVQATGVGPVTYVLSGKQKRACTVDYIANARAWGVNYILVNPLANDPGTLENPQLSRPVNKKTGKAFFGTRGKRSNKECV